MSDEIQEQLKKAVEEADKARILVDANFCLEKLIEKATEAKMALENSLREVALQKLEEVEDLILSAKGNLKIDLRHEKLGII